MTSPNSVQASAPCAPRVRSKQETASRCPMGRPHAELWGHAAADLAANAQRGRVGAERTEARDVRKALVWIHLRELLNLQSDLCCLKPCTAM